MPADDPKDYERQIMSPDKPKSDREWWARGEIERLREALRDAFASRRSLAQDSALASDAVLGYFNRHPEAGEAPLSHHRDGIAKAVIRALNYEPHEPK